MPRIITDRFSTQKLSPAQLEVLEHPDRLRTKTQFQNADKLMEMGLLSKKPHDDAHIFFYNRTEAGQEYLNSLENAKDNLTPENINEVARKFPDFLLPRVDIDRLSITLVLRDPIHGNTAVHTVRKVPSSDKEVEKIVKDLLNEIRHRARTVEVRWKYIPK